MIGGKLISGIVASAIRAGKYFFPPLVVFLGISAHFSGKAPVAKALPGWILDYHGISEVTISW